MSNDSNNSRPGFVIYEEELPKGELHTEPHGTDGKWVKLVDDNGVIWGYCNSAGITRGKKV